jgi:Zn-dependent M28 family amino/carboxypeptidase
VAPALIPGVDWSDHASFWEQGYPALMLTDTALYRYPHYHSAADTPDKVDYERLARVVTGLELMLRELASSP